MDLRLGVRGASEQGDAEGVAAGSAVSEVVGEEDGQGDASEPCYREEVKHYG